MNTNRRGLQLKTNYLLSVQGTTNSPSDNEWLGSWLGNNGTWTDGTFTTSLSGLVVRTNPIKYMPPFNNGLVPPQIYGFNNIGTLIPANNNSSFLPCYPVVNPPCTNCFPGIVGTLNNIVSNNILYDSNPIETDEINKDLAFNNIASESYLIDSSIILSDFYNANLLTNRGVAKSIEAKLNQGELNLVNSLLGILNPNTNIENNKKNFFNIYNKYLKNDSLSYSDNFNLFILAHQCPFTDGPVVYEARSLYGIINNIAEIYTDTYCEKLGFSYRESNDPDSSEYQNGIEKEFILNKLKSIENENRFKTRVSYEIYPNPAVSDFSISSTKLNDKLLLKIFDASGKLLISKSISIDNYKTRFNFNLINGIYFVNLINENGEKTIKKLVIVKD